MANLNIAAEIRAFLLHEPIYAGLIPKNISDDFSLIDSGALDSIGIFNLVSFLEKTFAISVEPQDLNQIHFQSIATIQKFVEARRE